MSVADLTEGQRSCELPAGWDETSLETICEIHDSRRIPVNQRERQQRIAAKSDDKLYPYYGATGQVGVIDDYIFEGEHVLLGEDGAPFLDPFRAKAYLVTGQFWVNNHAHILKSKIPSRYVCHYLNHIDYSEHVTGTTRDKLNQHEMKRICIRVAPLKEQERIVAKIEELFAELDESVARLTKARSQLEVFRQAVLKHAFEGKLTEQWRDENKDQMESAGQLLARVRQERAANYEQRVVEWKAALETWEADGKVGKRPRKPAKLKKSNDRSEFDQTDSDDPRRWLRCVLPDFVQIEMGQSPPSTTYNRRGDGLPFFQGKAEFGDLYPEKRVYCSSPKKVAKPGSVLLSVRAPVGPTNISTYECCIGRGLAALHPSDAIPSKFILYLFRNIEPALSGEGSGSTIDSITKDVLENLEFDLPPVEEQRRLVAEIEENLSLADHSIETIDDQLGKVHALHQSILRKAFAGELVPQDPNDEPASVLLDRIQTKQEDEL